MADRTERAAVGRIDLAYETFGHEDAPPLLLIAGLATQLLGWDERFCMQLADNGFRVIRFDNRDIGRSTHLDEAGVPDIMALLRGKGRSTAPYTLVDMAADTAGLLDALGLESAHVVGMSIGGMIAQQLAISHPHRVRSLTSIMSTPSRRVGQARRRAQRVLLLPQVTDEESAADRALRVYGVIGSPGYRLDERRVADVARRSFARGNNPAGVARQYAAIVVSPDRSPRLRKLTVPTLVIHGEDDPLVQLDGGTATADAVAGARLVFPGMGHDLPQQLWPQLVDEIVTHAESADLGPDTCLTASGRAVSIRRSVGESTSLPDVYRNTGAFGWAPLPGDGVVLRIAVDRLTDTVWVIGWNNGIWIHNGTPYIVGSDHGLWRSAGAAGWERLNVVEAK